MQVHRELYRDQHRFCESQRMPNFASALNGEISRIARKEVRAEAESLKKQSAQHRSQIAALKRQVAALEKAVRQVSKGTRPKAAEVPAKASDAAGLRFRAKGFAAHRARLGLSAAQAGAMLGVSGQTIYQWEQGKAKPRARQMPAIAAMRKLSKSQAQEIAARVIAQSR
jgi:DNA-binding XRE family transcriptional regulator